MYVRLDFLVRDWQNFTEEFDPADSKENQVITERERERERNDAMDPTRYNTKY